MFNDGSFTSEKNETYMVEDDENENENEDEDDEDDEETVEDRQFENEDDEETVEDRQVENEDDEETVKDRQVIVNTSVHQLTTWYKPDPIRIHMENSEITVIADEQTALTAGFTVGDDNPINYSTLHNFRPPEDAFEDVWYLRGSTIPCSFRSSRNFLKIPRIFLILNEVYIFITDGGLLIYLNKCRNT